MGFLWIIIIAAIVIIAILYFNSFIRLRNQVKNSWAQIDVQLKRRNDLIPNLVSTVKGYMKHEKSVLENVTKARASMMKATTMEGKAKASNMMTDTLKSLFAVAENYPNLKANENFMQLQEEITGTENKIAYSRQHYNDMVMVFNTKIQQFPGNMLAGIFHFKSEESFKTEEKEKKPVKVEF